MNEKQTPPSAPQELTETEWHKREAWFRQLLEASNDGFWEWDVPTGAARFSGRWAQMLGYGHGEIQSNIRTWELLLHPEDKPRVMQALQDHLDGKTPFYEAEQRLRTRDGRWRWIIDRGRVVERDADGRPLRAAGAHIDIEERKRHELERDEISRSRLEVLGVVSHELKNPLHALVLSIELERKLVETGSIPPTLSPVLDGMSQAVKRMERLVSDLLDVTRLEAQQLPLRIAEVQPHQLIEHSLKMLESTADQKSIKLAVELDPALTGVPIIADEDRMIQVLSNLIGNAIKFSPKGSQVTIRAKQSPPEGGSIRFEVEDQGPGIPKEQHDLVFRRFWQSRKDAYKGTGLGLYIAQGILQSHGGKIHVESPKSGGSRFWFTLPLLQPTKEKDRKEEAAA